MTLNIEMVRPGDLVYHLGQWRVVVATSFTIRPPVYTLELVGSYTVVAKARHKLEVRRIKEST